MGFEEPIEWLEDGNRFVILSYCVLILSNNRTNMVHDLRTGSYKFLVINRIS